MGIKVATDNADVIHFHQRFGTDKAIIRGKGDKGATQAAYPTCSLGSEKTRRYARGFTSGLAILFPRLSDSIYNALKAGDIGTVRALEDFLLPLEDIRAEANRSHNVSAIYAAMEMMHIPGLAGYQHPAPFNSPPPQPVLDRISTALADIPSAYIPGR